jgi:hypothetical protein
MLGFSGQIDLGWIDQAVNIQSTPAVAEAFDSKGSVWHVALGFIAELLPGGWPVVVATTFGGYELSKVEGCKPFAQISGAMLEFAVGMALAGAYQFFAGQI